MLLISFFYSITISRKGNILRIYVHSEIFYLVYHINFLILQVWFVLLNFFSFSQPLWTPNNTISAVQIQLNRWQFWLSRCDHLHFPSTFTMLLKGFGSGESFQTFKLGMLFPCIPSFSSLSTACSFADKPTDSYKWTELEW